PVPSSAEAFLVQCEAHHRDLHSFPTRRASDLILFVRRICRTGRGTKLWHGYIPKIQSFREGEYIVDGLVGSEIRNEIYEEPQRIDRKSTRLNSSHVKISYAVFCLKTKKAVQNQ